MKWGRGMEAEIQREATHLDQVRRLMGLKAIGPRSAWILVCEFSEEEGA